MPTYRYRCGGCGEEFEVWQSIKDDPIRTHDHGCGGELVKVLTAAGIVLKGSGFYRNDSRSGDAKRAGADAGGGGSREGGEQPGSKDTKSDGAGGSDAPSSPSSEPKTGPAPSGPSPASTSTP